MKFCKSFFVWCQSQFKHPLLLFSLLPSSHPQSSSCTTFFITMQWTQTENWSSGKNKLWLHFFSFLDSSSAGSIPSPGSRSGHRSICADKVCVSEAGGIRLWIQGAEMQRFGLAAKSNNTKLVTTVSLIYLGIFQMNEWRTGRFQSYFEVLDSERQRLQWMYTSTHADTKRTVWFFVSTEIIQCRNDEYFLILAAFLQLGKNCLVQKGTPRKTFSI